MKKVISILILFFIIGCASINTKLNPLDEVSILALQSKNFSAEFALEKELTKTNNFESSLVSYLSDGLKVFALINRPVTPAPVKGYPVLIFGHGFHPEPKKYGVSNSTGNDWRPGDYYRGMPETFANNGFLVVTPDYRGHNISEGFEFTKKSFLASSYYARDVLNALAALPSLENADLNNIFYLGHSMGGDVGLKVLLATDKFKAASLWSPVTASTMEQVLYYGKYYDQDNDKVDPDIMQSYSEKIEKVYAELGSSLSYQDVDPVEHLAGLNTPLIIQHARGDSSVPYSWSESLITNLHALEKDYLFYTYESDNHLFKDKNLGLAFERDLGFFAKYLND